MRKVSKKKLIEEYEFLKKSLNKTIIFAIIIFIAVFILSIVFSIILKGMSRSGSHKYLGYGQYGPWTPDPNQGLYYISYIILVIISIASGLSIILLCILVVKPWIFNHGYFITLIIFSVIAGGIITIILIYNIKNKIIELNEIEEDIEWLELKNNE